MFLRRYEIIIGSKSLKCQTPTAWRQTKPNNILKCRERKRGRRK
jgi:hypothetical protein